MTKIFLQKLLFSVITASVVSLCFCSSSKAQTVLTAGDIAIIGFNTDASPDDIVVLTLKTLSSGTVFYVNDNEVLTAGGSSFADLNEAEASFTVKAGQTIAAGTVMVLPWGGGLTSTTQYDWSVTAGAGLGNAEEIYIYNATSITSATPSSFICGATQGSNTGLIPNGLVNNQSWIDLGSSRAYRYKLTGATYTGTKSALLNALGNTSNWEAAATYSFSPTNWTFTVNAAPGAMRITEYMYAGTNGEFIEFTNTGGTAVDMTGWSFDDADRLPGAQSLSGFGTVQPGESVILTETVAATFRTAWNLCNGIKIIGGLTNNLGRADEINLYNTTGTLIDRLTYDDQTLGGVRTQNKSGWVSTAGLGSNLAAQWTLSATGDAEASYTSSGADIASPGKSSRATVNYSPCTVVVSGAPVISFNTSTTDYIDAGSTISPASPFAVSGVISDPTDPARTSGIDFIFTDDVTPVDNLTITVSSSNTAVVPLANISITGTGAGRNVKINPATNGYSVITISANDGTGTGSYVLNYAASIASVNTASTRFHTGAADASTAVMIDATYMLVADDENQVIRLYNRQNSGLPVKGFDFNSSLGLTDISGGIPREVDIESSVKTANRIYWLASHGNSSSGSLRPNRYRLFATDISGSGAAVTLSYVGRYDNLRTNLINWDVNNVHGLGANYFGLSAGAAAGQIPEQADGSGFNIEGLVIAPDAVTAYLCFRAPISPATNRTKALIVPVTNLAALVSGNPSSATAVFGAPIQLDLGGRGIREIKQVNAGQYLIIAGPHGEATGISPSDFRLYTWSGNPNNIPVLLTTNLTSFNVNGSFESIVDVPAPLTEGSQVQLLVDNGDAVYYNDGTIAKELSENNFKKFRSELVTLTGICIPSASTTNVTACNSYLWNSTNYTSSGIYTFLTTNAAGCDSTATLNLSINYSSSSTTSVTACGSYVWNAITYTASGTYNFVTVNAVGCDSTATLQLIVNGVPATPTVVNGPVNVCQYAGTAQQVLFSVIPVATGTSYVWTVPPTVSIISGQGTASISVTINSGFINNANKLIKVRAVSDCGTSAEKLLYLAAQLPGTPGQISGPANSCPFIGNATTATYSISPVAGASSYIWTAQNGTTVINHPNGSGINDITVNVSFAQGFSSSNITVQAVNDCGTSAARSLTVTRNAASTPGLISGPTNACANMLPAGVAATYSVAPIAGVSNYTWTAPAGAVISHPNGTGPNDYSITVLFPSGFVNGSITVSATNGCGTSGTRTLSVTRLNPAAPGVIDVIETASCPDRQFSYTLAGMPSNATSIVWEVPAGATIVSGQGATGIIVSYPASAVTGFVTAKSLSNCAVSTTRQLAVKLPACPPTTPFSRVNSNASLQDENAVTKMKIIVFNNPATTEFKVQVLSAAKEIIHAKILDVHGTVLKNILVKPAEMLHVGNDLTAGIYMIEFTQGKTKIVERLVKL